MQKSNLKIFKAIIVFLVIFAWIFSGWPQLWQNPAIPPGIQEAKASSSVVGQVVNV